MRRLTILLLIFLCVVAFCGAEEAMRSWTARTSGKVVQAQFLSYDNGYLKLKNNNGKILGIPLSAVSDKDQKYALSQIDEERTWTIEASGNSTKGHFVKLSNDFVVLLTPECKQIKVRRSCLSVDDQKYLREEAPIPLEQKLIGTWEGVSYSTGYAHHHTIDVKMEDGRLRGYDTISLGYTEDQISDAKFGRLKHDKGCFLFGFIATQEYNISLADIEITFKGVRAKHIHKGPGRDSDSEYSNDTIIGKYRAPGIIVGKLNDTEGRTSEVYLTRKTGGYDNSEPTQLARGKVHRMTCKYDPKFHYTLYIPESYDSSKPAPVLVNDSAGGNAGPLSKEMAEERGWIMLGLTESSNNKKHEICGPNCFQALLDVRRILNIHPKRYYFSGMSGGARRASTRGIIYAQQCAGVICIGAAYSQWRDKESPYYAKHQAPPLSIPVFFIVGKSDMNNGEVNGMYERARKQGRKSELIVHPGGHTWGRPTDHETAIRWLDEQWEQGAVL